MNQFLEDVLKGLSAKDKYLESKYFYNAEGDRLFQQIMDCDEYYPTRCEMDIFTQQKNRLAEILMQHHTAFDLVELGAGDATKSIHLLGALLNAGARFTYLPIDISANVIQYLSRELPGTLPGLQVQGLNGEYLPMLDKLRTSSSKPKVVLFLGGNIGNVPWEKAEDFCRNIRRSLAVGDVVVTGFDLKKDPAVILAAYNDKAGFTCEFNLNLLRRINRELNGDFHIDQFYHYPTYDPQSGACKSFLVSRKMQRVNVADESFLFAEGEPVFMEIAQKYSISQTDELAGKCGFEPIHHFFDSGRKFLDTVWKCV